MKCPTCKNSEENKCCRCGVEIPSELQRLEADPYSAEINYDYSPHLQCEDCAHESMMDI